MALLDVIQALMMPQEAEAAGLSAAKAAVRVKEAPKEKSKSKPKGVAKVAEEKPAEAAPVVAAPPVNPYAGFENIPGMTPYIEMAKALGEKNARTALEEARAGMTDPRFSAQVKYSEQGMISPLALGAIQNLVTNAPLPGIKDMREREAQMKDYVSVMKQQEEELGKNQWMYSDLSPFMNLLQNITGTDLKYKAPVNPMEKAVNTRLAFEKELSDLMERRGTTERQMMHEMLGQPLVTSAGYGPERPQARGPAARMGPDNSKFIYKEMTGLENAKKLHTALQEYSSMIASGAPLGTLKGKYNEVAAMLKNVDNMGGALTPQEAELSFAKLPHYMSIEVGPLTGKKSERISEVLSTVSSGMNRKINALHSTYPQNSELINKLSGQYAPASITQQGPAAPRKVQGGGIDFSKYKGK